MGFDYRNFGSKEVRALLGEAEQRGWVVTRLSSNNHLMLHHPDGDTTSVAHAASARNRAYQNLARKIRSKALSPVPVKEKVTMAAPSNTYPPATAPRAVRSPLMVQIAGAYLYPSDYVDQVTEVDGSTHLECHVCHKKGASARNLGVHSAAAHGAIKDGNRVDRSTWIINPDSAARQRRYHATLKAKRAAEKSTEVTPIPITLTSSAISSTVPGAVRVVAGPVPSPNGQAGNALNILAQTISELVAERDSWKARAENAETALALGREALGLV